MKKYFNLIIVFAFIFFKTAIYGQQLENKSTVKISETDLKSLIQVLKKYKIQHSIVTDSVKKSSISFFESSKVDTLSSTTAMKGIIENEKVTKDTLSNNIKSSEKGVADKNAIKAIPDTKKNEILVNSNELISLQNEIRELRNVLNTLVLTEKNTNPVENTKTETIKETKIIYERNNTPKPIISETFTHKTDTLYIVENTKTIDSLLVLNLQEKIKDFEIKLKENDSVINSLVINNIKKNDVQIAPIKQKQPLEEHFNNLFFENNKFELSVDNQNILIQLANLALTDKLNHIYLKGYASNSGNPTYNKTLSLKRTESVKNFLIKNGVNATKISSNFFGIDYNESNEAKARRVEITLFNN